MSEPVLQLQQITKIYQQGGRELRVLDQLDFDIQPAEMVALVGPSGSGKTTLLQIAGLLDSPTSGNVIIGGKNVSRAEDKERTLLRRNHIGFIYQFHHLLPEFSALENVMLPQMVAHAPVAKAQARATELLTSLGLAERIHHRPAALSGGEQQRVAIARALANHPALILADEPTGNLDPHTAESVFAMLLKCAREQGVAMLVATHNLDLAARMNRMIRL